MRVKRRHCDFCGKYYEGRGDNYCGKDCRDGAGRGYRVVAFGCAHLEYGFVDPSYLVAERFVREVKPDILILLGDYMDFGCISHWNKTKPRLTEQKRYLSDCDWGRGRLEKLRPHARRTVYLKGNHEDWLYQFIDENPVLEGKMSLGKDLGLDEMGIEAVRLNAVLSVGSLNFAHGWYVNEYHAAKHLRVMGDHIFYVHTHNHQVHTAPVRPERTPHTAMSLGCLCSRNPGYLKNKPSNWINGLGVFEVRGDGSFNPYFVPIINNACTYGGETWRA